MRTIRLLMLIPILLAVLQTAAQQTKNTADFSIKAKKIDSFMTAIHDRGQFMGAVLVASKGKLIYKKGFGFADVKTKEKFTPATPCYIGSLSKQFTAAGIVQLKEKGLIGYEQSIREHFPELPEFYQPVTIRNMLQHTSGLALFNDWPDMTEDDVFNILRKETKLRFVPGSKFEYCNANYTLLGMLIEKISKQTLDQYLTASIFKPCGMKNTYVDEPSVRNRKRAVGYYLFGDEYNYNTYIGGAASVVSTVEDLYKWDQALYHPSVISGSSLQEIFTPGSNEWESNMYGKQGYGFGWFISDHQKILQHDGGFAGFRSYIERQVEEHNTIIFISNIRHELIGKIREEIVNILNGKSYDLPKISAANWIVGKAKDKGMKQAIADYKAIESGNDSSAYYFSERECNSLGYYLLNGKKYNEAIQLFTLNTKHSPKSGNAFDSLGEAYLTAGDKKQALISYKKAVELDPSNTGAAEIIKKLEAEQ